MCVCISVRMHRKVHARYLLGVLVGCRRGCRSLNRRTLVRVDSTQCEDHLRVDEVLFEINKFKGLHIPV